MGTFAADLRAEQRFSRPPARGPLPPTQQGREQPRGARRAPSRSIISFPPARLASPLSQRAAAAARRLPGRRGLRSREATPRGASPRARGAVAAPPPALASTTPRGAEAGSRPPAASLGAPEPCRAEPSPRAGLAAPTCHPAVGAAAVAGGLQQLQQRHLGPVAVHRRRPRAGNEEAERGPEPRGTPCSLFPLPCPPLRPPPAAAPRPRAGRGRVRVRRGSEPRGGPRCELPAPRGPAAGRRARPRTCCSSSASLQAWLSPAGRFSNAKAAVQQSSGWAAGTGHSARTAGRLGQGLGTTPGSCLLPAGTGGCTEKPGRAARQGLQSLMAMPFLQDTAKRHWST